MTRHHLKKKKLSIKSNNKIQKDDVQDVINMLRDKIQDFVEKLHSMEEDIMNYFISFLIT